MQTRAGIDQLQPYLQNILTEYLQNMHDSIKFTWQQNNSRQRLGEITKSLEHGGELEGFWAGFEGGFAATHKRTLRLPG